MSMRIIAFDIGSDFACADNLHGQVRVRSWQLVGDRKVRAGQFFLHLQSIFEHDAVPFDVVFYERPFARGMAATRSLWGQAGILEAVAQCYQAAVVDMPPKSIKEWATGSGKADKQAMIAMAQVMGYLGENEHEADAFLGLHYAIAHCTKD